MECGNISKEKTFLLFMVLVVAGILGWRWWQHRQVVVTYRLTAEVEVDGTHYTGSGVVETVWKRAAALDAAMTGNWLSFVHGEAVPVELGPYGALFVTLGGTYGQSPPTLPEHVFGGPRNKEKYDDFLRRLADSSEVKAIRPGNIPPLVYFNDPKRPNDAECLDPKPEVGEGLTGPHIHFLGATLAMVHEPVTAGIERVLPWMAVQPALLVSRISPSQRILPSQSMRDRCTVGIYDFKQGMK